MPAESIREIVNPAMLERLVAATKNNTAPPSHIYPPLAPPPANAGLLEGALNTLLRLLGERGLPIAQNITLPPSSGQYDPRLLRR